MRTLGTMLLLSCCLPAAEKFVCDQPQESHACNYPNSQLQKALNEAVPGDTIHLQAGFTYLGSFSFRTHASADKPITVTSSKMDWLPGPNSRITPSDLPNIPVLNTNLQNEPALAGELDGAKKPPSHWHFVGIGFSVSTPKQFDNSIIHTGGMGVKGWTIQNAQELPDGLVFDRVIIIPPYDDSLVIQNALRPNGSNITIKNSFIWPIFCAGIECHAVAMNTMPGPMNVVNNFLSAASIPFMTGGNDPDYQGVIAANVTLKYNYLFRPLKWWANPGNPDSAYFRKNGSRLACTKNLLEFKGVDRATVEFNVHENIWADNYCMGQWFGFTVTPRQTFWESPGSGGSWGYSMAMDKLTASGQTFSWTGPANNMKPGHNICIEDHNAGPLYDCRKITAADNAAKTGTVSTPFKLAVTGGTKWAWVTDDLPMLRDVTMQNEVFRNVAGGFNVLARDRGAASGKGDEGKIVRLTIRNTLTVNTLNALGNTPALRFFPQDAQSTGDSESGGRDIVFEHNTFVWPTPAYNVMYFSADNMPKINKIHNISIRSNIFPDAAEQADKNIYALGASAAGGNEWGVVENFAEGDIKLTNNQFFAVGSRGCKVADCAKNSSKPFKSVVKFEPKTYRIQPGTAMAKAGHDGKDIGADYNLLPLISNLQVTPEDKAAVLQFDLAQPISDAGNTQPCVLEVSADENLKSYLGPYKVMADLNPVFFKQANASNRKNPKLPSVEINSGHVKWPLGGINTTAGDDRSAHDLSYPANTYYGRLMCYGDTQQFTFSIK